MGRVQEDVSTLNPGSGSQAQTKALGGGQEGDHRRHEETMGAEKGRSCESGSEEACEEEDGKGLRTGRGCRSVGVGGRAGCQHGGHLGISGAVMVGAEGRPPRLLPWTACHGRNRRWAVKLPTSGLRSPVGSTSAGWAFWVVGQFEKIRS